MIGNTDWNLDKSHNIELIRPASGGAPIPVPYDFDWSGLIAPPYARPNQMLGIGSVKQRLFRGFCRRSIARFLQTLSQMVQRSSSRKRQRSSMNGTSGTACEK